MKLKLINKILLIIIILLNLSCMKINDRKNTSNNSSLLISVNKKVEYHPDCWFYREADYFSCDFSSQPSLELSNFEKDINIVDNKNKQQYENSSETIIRKLKQLKISYPLPLNDTKFTYKIKELLYPKPIKRKDMICEELQDCTINLPPSQKELVITWALKDSQVPVAAAIFLIFVENNKGKYILKYSYGRNNPPTYRKNEENKLSNNNNLLDQWLLENNVQIDQPLIPPPKTQWISVNKDKQSLLEVDVRTVYKVDSIMNFSDDQSIRFRYKLWIEKQKLLRVVKLFNVDTSENACLSTANDSSIPTGDGSKIETGESNKLSAPIYINSLEKSKILSIDLEEGVLKRNDRLFAIEKGYSRTCFCNEKNEINAKNNKGININYSMGKPIQCNDIDSAIREANVFYQVDKASKIVHKLQLPFKIPMVSIYSDNNNNSGALNCRTNKFLPHLCVNIYWSKPCRTDAYNPGLIVHEFGHGLVKYLQVGRKSSWCGWDNNCPEPTTSTVFHDFVNIIAHYVTEQPCYPNYAAESCYIRNIKEYSPFDLAYDDLERRAGRSISRILWNIYQKMVNEGGLTGQLAYETAFFRTLTQYGWAETKIIRDTIIKCGNKTKCASIPIDELYRQYLVFAYLFKQNLSYSTIYTQIVIQKFGEAGIYVAENNNAVLESNPRENNIIRIWNNPIVKCNRSNKMFDLYYKGSVKKEAIKCMKKEMNYFDHILRRENNFKNICIANNNKEICINLEEK